jgi:hypothetical protein
MRWFLLLAITPLLQGADPQYPKAALNKIGREMAVPKHLQDDEEFRTQLPDLLDYGKRLFVANWTVQDGAGRPLTKGTGKSISDATAPLSGIRGFNRISGPDANSCWGCHNQPFGIPGGSGDFVTNVFVLGQRFDFVTFDPRDIVPTKGALDERSQHATLQSIGNLRKTTGMFGSGYLEMVAREMTEDLQTIRDGLKLGDRKQLISKGVSFGWLTRRKDGMWDVSEVEGLPRASILSPTPVDRPNLIVRPWHQAANVVSIREFTNNALNQHHGIQTTERFGVDTDLDGDGVMNEMTRADVTALTLYQASMAAPGRVIPNDPQVERAILDGEKVFSKIGCATCHVAAMPLARRSWTFTEPNPYNPPTNLRAGETKTLSMNLNDPCLPVPRLTPSSENAAWLDVPAYTDFKLHDITDPNDPSEAEPLDMNQTVWSAKFSQGNRRFLTRRLWGAANQPPYFHDGRFTTLREAVLAHSGEALRPRQQFQASSEYEQDALIEFLKSFQVLPPGTKDLVVDENFHAKVWRSPSRL